MRRCSLCSDIFSPSSPPPPIASVWMTMIATQIAHHSGFVGNPLITVLTRTDVAKTPPMSDRPRPQHQWRGRTR